MDAFVMVVAFEHGAQSARLHADNWIGARIEGGFFVKNLDTDDVLLEFVSSTSNGFRDDEFDKALETAGFPKGRTVQNSVQLIEHCFRGIFCLRLDRFPLTHTRILTPLGDVLGTGQSLG